MKVSISSLSNANQFKKINYNNKPKQVSFGGSDAFVKFGVDKTFDTAKDKIKEEINKEATKVIDKFKEFSKSAELCGWLDTVNYGTATNREKLNECFKKGYTYDWLPTGIKEPQVKDEDYLCFAKNYIEKCFNLNAEKPFDVNKKNFIMIQSKDKEVSESFIDYLHFEWERQFVRESGFPKQIHHAKDFLNKKALGLTDFVTVKDTANNPDNLRNAIKEAVSNADKRYAETGRSTILHVENMESILSGGKSVADCISELGVAPFGNNKTLMIFSNTKPNISSGACGEKIALDVLDDAKNCVNNFHKASNTELLQPHINEMRDITKNYLEKKKELQNFSLENKDKINTATKKFKVNEIKDGTGKIAPRKILVKNKQAKQYMQVFKKEAQKETTLLNDIAVQVAEVSNVETPQNISAEINEVKKSAQNKFRVKGSLKDLKRHKPVHKQNVPSAPNGGDDGNKLKELLKKAINKVKENKKAAIITGVAVAALAATGIVVHAKKGKAKNVPAPDTKQPAQNTQSVVNVDTKESVKTQTQTNYNVFNTTTPDIFSEFQK